MQGTHRGRERNQGYDGEGKRKKSDRSIPGMMNRKIRMILIGTNLIGKSYMKMILIAKTSIRSLMLLLRLTLMAKTSIEFITVQKKKVQ